MSNISGLKIKGIDVSAHQGKIDWNKVAKSDVKFAIIRAGWAGYDGSIEEDKFFKENMQNAKSAGLDIGVYLYSYVKTTGAAVIAARQLIDKLKGYQLKYPVAFDIEDALYTKMTKVENSIISTAFLNEIEAAKYYGVVYTYTYFADSYLNMATLSKFDTWIADYRSSLGYKGEYGMWQYSSEGKVDGITTNVDLNYAYRDYPALIAKSGLNNLPATPDNTPQKDKYKVEVFSFETLERAKEISQRITDELGCYNEIKKI